MYLSDQQIQRAIHTGQVSISPLSPPQIQPVSIDLTLDDTFIIPDESFNPVVSIANPQSWQSLKYSIAKRSYYDLYPHSFVLGSTAEQIHLRSAMRGEHDQPFDLYGQMHGKSTFGRLGLLVHITAGVIDPGFQGKITLEFANVGPFIIRLIPGIAICQLTLAECGIVAKPYGSEQRESKYQGQGSVTWPK